MSPIKTASILASAAAQQGEGGFGAPTWPKENGVATIRYCFDPEIDQEVRNIFVIGVSQYQQALPGCFRFELVPVVQTNTPWQWNTPSARGLECEGMTQGRRAVYVHGRGTVNDPTQAFNAPVAGYATDEALLSGVHPELSIPVIRSQIQTHGADAATAQWMSNVIHEWGHVLGMYHEMARPDAHNFIRINRERIEERVLDQFKPVPDAFIALHYDYDSIMNYNANAFVKPELAGLPFEEQVTLQPINCDEVMKDINGNQFVNKCPELRDLGHQRGLSKGDVEQLRMMYSCPATATWTGQQVETNGEVLLGAPSSYTYKVYTWGEVKLGVQSANTCADTYTAAQCQATKAELLRYGLDGCNINAPAHWPQTWSNYVVDFRSNCLQTCDFCHAQPETKKCQNTASRQVCRDVVKGLKEFMPNPCISAAGLDNLSVKGLTWFHQLHDSCQAMCSRRYFSETGGETLYATCTAPGSVRR